MTIIDMSNRIRISVATLIATGVVLACPLNKDPGVSAQTPYQGYVQTEWTTDASAPVSFVPDKVSYDGGQTRLKDPQDVFVRDDLLYILDSGNSRITVWDPELEHVRDIPAITDISGGPVDFTQSEGIYVSEDGKIYIADTAHARILIADQSGKLIQVIEKPDSDAFTTTFFKPRKVLADANGSVYVIAEGVYQGALVYSAEGEFTSYFGSARIQPSLKLLADQVWKKILSKTARSKMNNYVPVEYTSFDIDPMGFIYTCTTYSTNNVEQIRKLNYLGNNIHVYQGNYGEPDIVGHRTNTYITAFLDLTIREDNILFALDQTRGRVYAFDPEGNRLFTFGNLSGQVGGFAAPTAIETIGQAVYVLDFTKGSITRFKPTEYASKIMEAGRLYHLGRYEDSIKPWREVLRMNSNYELAYTGMGQAMMRLGDYKAARNYFRLGYDRENESRAYDKMREQKMREQAGFVMIAVVLLMTAAVFLSSHATTKRLAALISRKRRTSGGISE